MLTRRAHRFYNNSLSPQITCCPATQPLFNRLVGVQGALTRAYAAPSGFKQKRQTLKLQVLRCPTVGNFRRPVCHAEAAFPAARRCDTREIWRSIVCACDCDRPILLRGWSLPSRPSTLDRPPSQTASPRGIIRLRRSPLGTDTRSLLSSTSGSTVLATFRRFELRPQWTETSVFRGHWAACALPTPTTRQTLRKTTESFRMRPRVRQPWTLDTNPTTRQTFLENPSCKQPRQTRLPDHPTHSSPPQRY